MPRAMSHRRNSHLALPPASTMPLGFRRQSTQQRSCASNCSLRRTQSSHCRAERSHRFCVPGRMLRRLTCFRPQDCAPKCGGCRLTWTVRQSPRRMATGFRAAVLYISTVLTNPRKTAHQRRRNLDASGGLSAIGSLGGMSAYGRLLSLLTCEFSLARSNQMEHRTRVSGSRRAFRTRSFSGLRLL